MKGIEAQKRLKNPVAKSFIDRVVNGTARKKDIDDFIAIWHRSNSEVPLYKYLGMTKEEYEFWVEDEKNLDAILESRADEIGLGL